MLSTVLICAVVGAVAIVASQARAGHDEFSFSSPSAGVLVLDQSRGLIGRINVESGAVDATTALGSTADVELVQSANTAIVVDRSRDTAAVLDVTTLSLGSEVALPSHRAQVLLVPAGIQAHGVMDAVVMVPSNGQVWRERVSDFEDVADGRAPEFEFGAGAAMTLGPGGELYVASPRDGAVYLVGDDGAQRRGAFSPFRVSGSRQVELSVGPAGWAVLDPAARRVFTSAGSVDLAAHGTELALEVEMPDPAAGPAEGRTEADAVVATDEGLLRITAATVQLASGGGEGQPARPVHIGDCVYGVWDSEIDVSGCDYGGEQSPAARARIRWAGSDSSRPVLRTDGRSVVANNPTTGETWAVGPAGVIPVSWDSAQPEAKPMAGGAPSDNETFIPAPPAPDPDPSPSPNEDSRASKGQTPFSTEPAPPSKAEPGRPELLAGQVTARVDTAAGTVELSWDPFVDVNHDREAINYVAQRLVPGDTAGTCKIEGGAPEVNTGDIQSTTSTSTLFGGAPPPDGGYRFIVWGATADECVPSEPIVVSAPPVPGVVTDLHGSMAWTGSRYDWEIAPGSAARYEVQGLDTSGAPIGDIRAFSGTAVPRETLNGRFGETVSMRLRACTLWGTSTQCGPWSSHAAPSPSLDFTLVGLAYSDERSEWTWSALPENSGVRIRPVCSSRADPELQSERGNLSCRYAAPMTRENALLVVQSGTAIREFEGRDY